MRRRIIGRMQLPVTAAAIFVAALITSHGAEARAFIGFGFGFPGFVGPPIIPAAATPGRLPATCRLRPATR